MHGTWKTNPSDSRSLSLMSRGRDFDGGLHQRRLNVRLRNFAVYLRSGQRRKSVHRRPPIGPRCRILVRRGFSWRRFPPQPHVAQRLRRRHPLARLPDEAALHEVHESRLLRAARLQRTRKSPRRWRAPVFPAPGSPADDLLAAVWTFRDRAIAGNPLRADEVAGTLARRQEPGRRHSAEFDGAGELVRLVLARKQRTSGGELGEDAAEAPHVDWEAVARAEDHFGGAVEARLDVRVDALVLVATRTKVDHLRTSLNWLRWGMRQWWHILVKTTQLTGWRERLRKQNANKDEDVRWMRNRIMPVPRRRSFDLQCTR